MMGENSKIEWCDHTMNFWVGCTKVSAACDFCYAETWAKRSGHPELWEGERRRTVPANWAKPHRWNLDRLGTDQPRARVFTNSLADFFDNQVPVQWRREAWHMIDQTPNLHWLILTKRPQNIAKMLPEQDAGYTKPWGGGWANVWLGTTCENQEVADRNIPVLLAVPAAMRFVSLEPLLGPIDLVQCKAVTIETPGMEPAGRIDWTIVGGESGPHARPMHPDLVRSLRDQCAAAGVAFFFKQWGEWLGGEANRDQAAGPMHSYRRCDNGSFDWPRIRASHSFDHKDPWSGNVCAKNIGKQAAGRLLDGIEHNAIPQ
jgi:protein gp37